MASTKRDKESNRLSGRMRRYARVGTEVGGMAAKVAGARVLGRQRDRQSGAEELAALLGGLKGPIMKLAQLSSTIPDLLPPEYTKELSKLQASAPPMGRSFVKRRMAAELGRDWNDRFARFDLTPAAAASLGQVHRAAAKDGRELACKLQYPDMDSAVEADLNQLKFALSIHKRMGPAIDTTEIGEEIGDRVREELDYVREARHMNLYGELLGEIPEIRVPSVVPDLSTRRLLTMEWLDGQPLLSHVEAGQEVRDLLARTLFKAWWTPFIHHGVIHGDPHLGNYTVIEADGSPAGINLLDFGCVRIFPPRFVTGVTDLYHGLLKDDEDAVVGAYESWGFKNLSRQLIDALNIWARFIYGPLLEDRVRTIADGVAPSDFGRKQAFQVHRALKEFGPVRVPREFVFMDRAAIGLGAVFLHLRAELNFYRLFNDQIDDFDQAKLKRRQEAVLGRAGLTPE